MEKLVIKNLKVLLIWGLAFLIGYCFGGLFGVGIAALIILLIQVLL